jgi:hypothetical protein
MRYGLGGARIGFFDETFAVDSVDYVTMVKRDANGALLWSSAFTEQPRGSEYPVTGARIDNALYALYNTKERCMTYSGEIDCTGMRLSVLNYFDGTVASNILWKTNYATEVSGGSTYHYSRRLRPLDMDAIATSKQLFLMGMTDGALADTPDSNGELQLFIMQMIRDDVLSDERPTSGFSRNDMTSVVTDHAAKLQWIDGSWLIQDTWTEALDNICPSRDFDGIGWRLPTLDELLGIVDDTQNSNPYLYDIFQFREDDTAYWTSEENDADSAVGVLFNTGGPDGFLKTDSLYIRCVRSIE